MHLLLTVKKTNRGQEGTIENKKETAIRHLQNVKTFFRFKMKSQKLLFSRNFSLIFNHV